jgi:hypothetical protein
MAEGTATLYKCENTSCTLGKVGEPGHFTGGITAEQVNLLTGAPVESLEEGTDYGEGVCPNCGVKGTPDGEHSYSDEAGTDPTEGEDPMPTRLSALQKLATEQDPGKVVGSEQRES